MGGVQAGLGQQQTPGDQAAGDGRRSRDQRETGDVDGFGAEHHRPARHRGEGHSDHAGAVLLGDRQHRQNRDDGLAEVNADQGELGRILAGATGPPGDTCVEAAIPALAATVSATAPAISHQVPAIVRSLVHSARSASVTRLSAAARPARRTVQPLHTRREPEVRPMAAAGSSRSPSCTDSSRALIGAGVRASRTRPPG